MCYLTDRQLEMHDVGNESMVLKMPCFRFIIDRLLRLCAVSE